MYTQMSVFLCSVFLFVLETVKFGIKYYLKNISAKKIWLKHTYFELNVLWSVLLVNLNIHMVFLYQVYYSKLKP